MASLQSMGPREDHADWGRHIYRELNVEADALAARHSFTYVEHNASTEYSCYRVFFDGSCTEQASGGGWILYGAVGIEEDGVDDWVKLAEMSFALGQRAIVTAAELEASLSGVAYLCARLQGREMLSAHLASWKVLDTDMFQLLELSGLIL